MIGVEGHDDPHESTSWREFAHCLWYWIVKRK